MPSADPRSAVADQIQQAIGLARAGRYGDASSSLQQALKSSRDIKYAEAEAATLSDMSVVQAAQGQYPEALKSAQASKAIYAGLVQGMHMPAQQSPGALIGMDVAMLNSGAIKAYLGQYQAAMDFYSQALGPHSPPGSWHRGDPPVPHTREIYRAMATVAGLAAHEGEAKQYATMAQQASESEFLLSNDALLGYLDLRPPSAAATASAPAVVPSQDPGLRPLLPATVQFDQLMADAIVAEHDGDTQRALSIWLRIAARAAAQELVDSQRTALVNAQRLARVLKQPDLEIYLGKRAVNAYQSERGQLASLDRESRKAFASESRTVYDSLADGLVAAGRLAEAEFVLDLSRQSDAFAPAASGSTVPYSSAENALIAHEDRLLVRWRDNAQAQAAALRANPYASQLAYQDATYDASRAGSITLATQLIESAESALREGHTPEMRASLEASDAMIHQQLDAGFGAGECGSQKSDPRETDLRRRLAAIEQAVGPFTARSYMGLRAASPISAAHYECLQKEGNAIEDSLAQFDATDRAAVGVAPPVFSADAQKVLEASQASLRGMPAGTATLHFVRNEHAVRIILSTATKRISRESPTTPAAVDALIQEFTQSLSDRGSDPRRPAHALYQLLIAPVAQDLRQAHAVTLQLALDGKLRYVPFAALFDGEHWLVEQYRLVSATTRAGTVSRAVPANRWRVAAFGSSKGGFGLPPLPSVAAELNGIVRGGDGHKEGATGDIVRLDDQFTANALRDALSRHFEVVHIASHFDLLAEEPSNSFLLLGNGERLTLAEIKQQNYRFDGVRLLTLSACDTASDVSNRYGQELEGLATFMLNQGAGAVLSTLWSVDDASTALLMQTFYRTRLSGSLTSAQALQDAQLALIGVSAAEGSGVMAADRGAFRPSDERPAPERDRGHLYAHPYFWAPFVLSGDWL
jgi:CHAT domain-containing protein